ncbi:hypothetical protein [Promicromonospora sukumoe]|uniref:hypothetical protein n=1 Tax=Promicromonospora sukumoe TaxID=88382 RepID=UPI00364B38DF
MNLDAITLLAGAPSPSPAPIEVLVAGQAATPGFSAWIPLVAALLALCGVVYASHKTGENMIKAEDRRAVAAIEAERERARLAEAAEDRRVKASNEAEDRRMRAAIDAENLRHENDLRRATRDHMLDTVRDTYAALEVGRRELQTMSRILKPIGQNMAKWAKKAEQHSERWSSALDQYHSALASVVLVGSDSVSNLAQQLDTDAWVLGVSIDIVNDTEDLRDVGFDIYTVKRETDQVGKVSRELLAAMRAELHPQSPSQAPSS